MSEVISEMHFCGLMLSEFLRLKLIIIIRFSRSEVNVIFYRWLRLTPQLKKVIQMKLFKDGLWKGLFGSTRNGAQ